MDLIPGDTERAASHYKGPTGLACQRCPADCPEDICPLLVQAVTCC